MITIYEIFLISMICFQIIRHLKTIAALTGIVEVRFEYFQIKPLAGHVTVKTSDLKNQAYGDNNWTHIKSSSCLCGIANT